MGEERSNDWQSAPNWHQKSKLRIMFCLVFKTKAKRCVCMMLFCRWRIHVIDDPSSRFEVSSPKTLATVSIVFMMRFLWMKTGVECGGCMWMKECHVYVQQAVCGNSLRFPRRRFAFFLCSRSIGTASSPSDLIPTLSRTPGWVSHLFLWLGKSSIWGRIPLPGRGTGTAEGAGEIWHHQTLFWQFVITLGVDQL